jgi:hypothetical protein
MKDKKHLHGGPARGAFMLTHISSKGVYLPFRL